MGIVRFLVVVTATRKIITVIRGKNTSSKNHRDACGSRWYFEGRELQIFHHFQSSDIQKYVMQDNRIDF